MNHPLITVKDKQFTHYISYADIQSRISEMAKSLDNDLRGKDPLFIVILNGAFMFAADLLKELSIECEVVFTRLSSYEGTSTTGELKELMGIKEHIKGRHVVILEDIVDSGTTMHLFLPMLKEKQPASISIAALLIKPAALEYPIEVNYHCFSISNEFIVGYGLDYDGYGRNLKDIYQLVE